MPFSGSPQNPYWISIQSDGVHASAGMQSEQIPVVVGDTYALTVTFGYEATWASGASVTLKIYNAAGTQIAAAPGGGATNMNAGQQYAVSSGSIIAPAGASYALATVIHNGTPATTNRLNVYNALISDQTSTPVNVNYAFVWAFWPWSAINSAVLAWNYNPVLVNDWDSLALDGQIELMGGPGVRCSVSELLDSNGQGPIFRLLAPASMNSQALGYQSSFDLNAPQPTQDVVASMLLDGERPFGTRSSNRQMSLPVIIFGTQAGGMKQVLAAREYLMSIIDQQTWIMKWTPADTGLGMLFDCFRALPTTPVYGFNYSAGGTATGSSQGRPNYPIALMTLNIQALPYGRSDLDGVQSLQFSNGLIAGPATPSAVTLDNFTSFNAGANPLWVQDTTSNTPQGGSSVKYLGPQPHQRPWPPAVYTSTLSSPVSIAGLQTLTVTAGQVWNEQFPHHKSHTPNVLFQWVLKDDHGKTLSFRTTVKKMRYSHDMRNPYWTRVNVAIPQNKPDFDYNAISSYTVTISNHFNSAQYAHARIHVFLTNLIAQPQTISNPTSPRGTVYNLFGLPGSARAPISIEAQLPAPAPVTKEFTSAGSGTWQVPKAVYQVQAEAWGGGGAGGSTASYFGLVREYNPLLLAMLSADATDSSGNGYNGTATNVTFAQGNTGIVVWDSASFNGTSSTLTFPVNPYGGKAYTYSIWFNEQGNAQGTFPTLIGNRNLDNGADNTGFVLYLDSGASYGLAAVVGNGTTHTYLNGGTGYSSSGWNHVTLTYDGTTLRLYLNGTQVATAALSGAVAPGSSSVVGAGYNTAGSGFFKGLLQGAAIMPVTLTATQVQQLYQSGAPYGGGGGGGEYAAEPALVVRPGTKVPWSVGAGGVPAQVSPTVIQFAKAGAVGHWTCPAGVTSVLAECWGGGAAGAAGGGGGGGGEYAAQQVTVVPGTTYWVYAGRGGTANTATSSAGNHARNGAASWFGPSGAKFGVISPIPPTLWADGGLSGLTGSTPGGNGGSGSSATTHFPGGNGGSSPGTGGGGGGGAAGSAGPGGRGGDSAANSALGRYAAGGAGGSGTGQGGSGGTGSPAPGFPVKGAAPGGGGGGGYTGPRLLFSIQPSLFNPNPGGNYLGADGGDGMVQLTYTIGSGNGVNGGSTTFGSAGTTGTTVTAHGGTTPGANVGGSSAGGSGSVNTVHGSGGTGGLYTSGPQASWFGSPYLAARSVAYALQLGGHGAYFAASGTSATAAASCSQGVSIVLVASHNPVTDLTVTDTSGNDYVLVGSQGGGTNQTLITTYAFVANIASPITTSTTITIQSATAMSYEYLWYTSPYLVSGVTAQNLGSGHGNSSTVSATFGAADTQTLQYELVVIANDTGATPSGGQPLYANTLWYVPNATSSQADTTGNSNGLLSAFIGFNQGGGTSGVTGDAFSCAMSASSDWSALCIPLVAANQIGAPVALAVVTGNNPAAGATAWTAGASISPNGMLACIGFSLSAAPTGMTDSAGNHYTLSASHQIPTYNAWQWMFTAPVTASLAQGATGAIQWGGASATPAFRFDNYWLPNAVGIDPSVPTQVTGTGTSVSNSYAPFNAADMVLAAPFTWQPTGFLHLGSLPGAPWNYVAFDQFGSASTDVFMAQGTENQVVSFTGAYASAAPWCLLMAGFTQTLAGAGGGAAGGPSGAGYPAMSNLGAPGYAGGGHGGNGATPGDQPGGGAAVPGGGGGGTYSSHNSTSPQSGGAGGQGLLRLTYQPPSAPYNTLILHSPGQSSPPSFSPLVPVPVTDLPNNTEYTVQVPSLVPYINAEFNGSYTVLLAAYAWNSSTVGSPRTLTVTVNQYEYPGGPRYSVQAARAVTPATDVVNGIVNLGEVTLPLKDYAQHNDQSYFTVSIMDSDQGDSFQDVIFLDTTGQTAIINIAPGTPGFGQYVAFYVDEPTFDRDLGFVGATTYGRQHQVSVLEYAMLSGGPFFIEPGDNILMAYSPAGAPNIGVTYSPRWFLDRMQ